MLETKRASLINQVPMLRSDEGPTLDTSAYENFTEANLNYHSCG